MFVFVALANVFFVVVCAALQRIKVWSAHKDECLRTLSGHTDLVRCIRFDDNYIVSGSYDWYTFARTKNKARKMKQNEKQMINDGHVLRLFFSMWFFSSHLSSTVRVWDFHTGQLLQTLLGHSNRVFRVQFDHFKIISSSQVMSVSASPFHFN